MDSELRWEGGRWVYAAQLLTCAGVLTYRALACGRVEKAQVRFPASFVNFQRSFLLIFFLASVADALQNVYSEALYESYGLRRKEIATLFAVGYGSSLFLGTFIAASADYIGRKRACILFCSFQLMGSVLKQYSDFRALCVAHVCLGIATPLLYSSFESWMIAEHEKMGFRQEWLSETFWLMAFSTGVVATGSGAIANVIANWQGSIGPASLVFAPMVSVLSAVVIKESITENVGMTSNLWRPLYHGLQCLSDRKVLLLGWTQACFDFSVIIFWFLWTPTLVADGREVHSGMVFTRLMASVMLGATIAACLLQGPFYLRPESFLPTVILVGGLSLFLPAYDHQELRVLLWCFCVFHICVGIALPSLARLRSMYIPSDRRAAVMSIYRVPVYVAVLFVMIKGGVWQKLDNSAIFGAAILGLLSGAGCIRYLGKIRGLTMEIPVAERP